MVHLINDLKISPQLIVFAAWLTAVIIAMLIIPSIIKIALRKNLLDNPNHRTSHKAPVPTLGGIGIFVAMLIGMMIWLDYSKGSQLLSFFIGISVLFIMGIIDDLKELSAKVKFLVQILVAVLLILSGARISTLYGLFGIYDVPLFVQYILTVIIIAGMTNAVNLLDGIDGLAGGIGAIGSLVFTILFLSIGEYGYAVISACLMGSLLGFLRYNFSPAKIFMGDTGSLLIGFSLAFFGIKFLQLNLSTDHGSMILVFGILVLPVFDTLRVFTIRILNKRSPFSPDKNHIHHLLLKTGYDHKKASIFMYIACALIISEAFVLRFFGLNILVSLVVLFGSTIFLSELITLVRVIKSHRYMAKLFNKKDEFNKENQLLKKLNS